MQGGANDGRGYHRNDVDCVEIVRICQDTKVNTLYPLFYVAINSPKKKLSQIYDRTAWSLLSLTNLVSLVCPLKINDLLEAICGSKKATSIANVEGFSKGGELYHRVGRLY